MRGHYTFPFSFLLPASMSGSFFYNDNNYIKYPLTAYLASYDKKNDNQLFKMNLNVNELVKHSVGKTLVSRKSKGQCCGCCKGYGEVDMKL